MKKFLHNIHWRPNLSQIIALVFFATICLGALLLSLPCSTKPGVQLSLTTAFFTATSAVCVTGLSVIDIYTSLTFFGQVVLISLIEIGGLGFMSVISIIFHFTGHKDGIQSLSLMAKAIGAEDINAIKRIQKKLVLGSFSFELLGAILLFFTFREELGIKNAIWYGIFHSISAFCNAGFDLWGVHAPGSSLTTINQNPLALTILAFLVIIGGLGFMVWDDISMNHSPRNWSVNTKLVLSVTFSLLLLGFVAFFFLEFKNPETMGNMTVTNQLSNAFFQSVTLRTAGFAGVDQASLTDSSIALSFFLMMIGGSAGSTAGGIKTITILILLKALISGILGKKTVTIMNRTITSEQVTYAYTLVGSFMILSFLGGFFINLTSQVGFANSLYESVSALATVGLSLGITSALTLPSKILIMLYMFIGRVGLLTLTIGFFKVKENPAIKYPVAKIMIG